MQGGLGRESIQKEVRRAEKKRDGEDVPEAEMSMKEMSMLMFSNARLQDRGCAAR